MKRIFITVIAFFPAWNGFCHKACEPRIIYYQMTPYRLTPIDQPGLLVIVTRRDITSDQRGTLVYQGSQHDIIPVFEDQRTFVVRFDLNRTSQEDVSTFLEPILDPSNPFKISPPQSYQLTDQGDTRVTWRLKPGIYVYVVFVGGTSEADIARMLSESGVSGRHKIIRVKLFPPTLDEPQEYWVTGVSAGSQLDSMTLAQALFEKHRGVIIDARPLMISSRPGTHLNYHGPFQPRPYPH